MNMNTFELPEKETEYFWHIENLRSDDEFRKDLQEIKRSLTISRGKDKQCILDLDWLRQMKLFDKVEVFEAFLNKWLISEYVLTTNILRSDPKKRAPLSGLGMDFGFNIQRNMIEAYIPLSITKAQYVKYWQFVEIYKLQHGINPKTRVRTSKKQSKVAYRIWKLKIAKKKWPEIEKVFIEDDSVAKVYEPNELKRIYYKYY